MKAKTLTFLLIGLFLLGTPVSALADDWYTFEYGFTGVTNNDNSGDSVAIGEAQLFMHVHLHTNGEVSFLFGNEGDEAASITDIYFDDLGDGEDDPNNLLNYLSAVINDAASGVSFAEGASPGNLPSGNAVGFSSDWSADSDNPTQPNGVNPGESVEFTFDLNGSYDFDSVLAALDSSTLSVGLHVQGFDGGYSESFVSDGPGDPVPEPATMLLFGTGLIGLARMRRKKK